MNLRHTDDEPGVKLSGSDLAGAGCVGGAGRGDAEAPSGIAL